MTFSSSIIKSVLKGTWFQDVEETQIMRRISCSLSQKMCSRNASINETRLCKVYCFRRAWKEIKCRIGMCCGILITAPGPILLIRTREKLDMLTLLYSPSWNLKSQFPFQDSKYLYFYFYIFNNQQFQLSKKHSLISRDHKTKQLQRRKKKRLETNKKTTHIC